jgi:hypothetical protein
MPLDDDDDRPRSKRRKDDDDDRPRSKRRDEDDEDDDDDRPRSKRKDDDDDEDDRPRSKRKAVDDDEDDEDDRPRSKRKAVDDEEDDDRPRSKRRKDDDEDDEDEDDEDDDRPRRRKKNKRGTPWLMIGLIGLLLAGLGVGLYFLLSGGSSGVNTKYLPDGSQFVATVNVEELLASKAYKQLSTDLKKSEKDFKTEEEFGLSVSDIASVQIGGLMSGGKPDGVVALRIRKSVKGSELTAKIKGDKFKEEAVGKYTLYTRNNDALCVPESNVVLIGEPASLRKVLQRDKAADLSPGLKTAMKDADFSKTLAVAVSLKDVPKNGLNQFGMGGADEMVKGAEAFTASVAVKSDISWKLSVTFKDSKTADDVKKMIDGAVTMVKANKMLPPDAVAILDSMKTETSGSRVENRGTIDVSKVSKAVQPFGGMFP